MLNSFLDKDIVIVEVVIQLNTQLLYRRLLKMSKFAFVIASVCLVACASTDAPAPAASAEAVSADVAVSAEPAASAAPATAATVVESAAPVVAPSAAASATPAAK